MCAHSTSDSVLHLKSSRKRRRASPASEPGLPFILWHKHVGGIFPQPQPQPQRSMCVCVSVTGPTGSMEILLPLSPKDWRRHAAFLVLGLGLGLGLVLHIFEFYFNFFLLYFSQPAPATPRAPSPASASVGFFSFFRSLCNFLVC